MAYHPSLHQRRSARIGSCLKGLAIGLSAALCSVAARHAGAEPALEVPAHNRPDQTVPPPRPPASEVDAKIQRVFEAIVRNDPALAASSFFPREAFLLVKDMRDPGKYYDQLRRRFDSDIHALHASVPNIAQAHYERFELAQRGGFVPPHGEANLLPYWAARHSVLHYRVDGQPRTFEVRVLITWDDHWYVIHLSEFH